MTFKENLKGGFKLLALDGDGIKHFDGTKQEGLRSFILPVLMIPLNVWFATVFPPKGMETGYGAGQIMTTVLAHTVIALALSLLLLWGFCKVMGVMQNIWLYLSASNWASVAFFIVLLPLTVYILKGGYDRDQMDRIYGIITIFGYIVTGCVAWRALKVNWQLAGAFTICCLAINQELSHLLFWVQGIPIPW